ncbi:hypothetical protein QBC41DRAFT_235686 [Cercophora samala]|uniref:Uncharacterized protein n=1 Tax=Cercophora samala TaxID=330535 RepID=A0AA39YZW6_9PEZI|nr:hypothetical protein QBC41DRAFT_235686 [Cercophora samala]
MGFSDLLDEIESGGATRSYRDEEDIAYKKPVTNLAAKEKVEKNNRYYYATGPVSCGGRSKPTPVYHPPNWVYAPGDAPPPAAVENTNSSTTLSGHRQQSGLLSQADQLAHVDAANEAVADVEPATNKAVHAKADEADHLISSDHDATCPFDTMDVDALVSDVGTPSSRRTKALKKKAGNSPKGFKSTNNSLFLQSHVSLL